MRNRNMCLRAAALVLALVMAAAMLAACGQAPSSSAASSSPSPASADNTPAAAAQDGPLEPYAEPITIRVGRSFGVNMNFTNGDSVDDNPWTRAYKEKLNIEIENMWVVDGSQKDSKLNAAISAGDYPDIFTVNMSQYAELAQTGAIADVTGLYDSYLAGNGKLAAVDIDNGLAKDAITIDGKVYGLPIIEALTDSMQLLWIRQDWLDALGLERPETIDDVMQIAEAFVTQDPDGNGADDTYAFAFDGKNFCGGYGDMEGFFEMYNAYPLAMSYGSNYSLVEQDGEIIWGGETEGAQEAVAALAQMYRDGWIPADFGTTDANGVTELMGRGKAGMTFGPMYCSMSMAAPLFTNFPDAELVCVPLPGKDGPAEAFAISPVRDVVVVSSKCEHPEALFKMWNLGKDLLAYNLDFEEYQSYNGDDTTYNIALLAVANASQPMKNLDNYYKISAAVESGDTSGLNTEQLNNYEAIVEKMLGKDPATVEDINDWAIGYGYWSVFADPNGGYAAAEKAFTNGWFKDAAFIGAPTDRMSAVSSTLTDHIITGIIQIIYGEKSPETWPTLVQQWHELGGDIVLKDASES